MIVVLLNQKAVGKTILALHPARMGREGTRVTFIDADPPDSALDWSQQRARGRVTRLFGVTGPKRDTLRRKAAELAQDVDHHVIDRAPRVTVLMRSALLATDLLLITAPSPFVGRASAGLLVLLAEARIYRSELRRRFALNGCGACTVIACETATLADHDPPVLRTTIGQHVIHADAVQSDRLAFDIFDADPPARDHRARPREQKDRTVMRRSSERGFTTRLSPPDNWIRDAGAPPPCAADVSVFTARLTIDVMPAHCGRINILAFRRGVTVAEMPRELPAREFPANSGEPS